MSDLHFAHAWVLVAIAAVPAVYVAWALRSAQQLRRAGALSRVSYGGPRYAATTLLGVAAIGGIVAAAQPRWGTEQSAVPRIGADLVIVLDISRSMEARDVAPSRLEAAKTALRATLTRVGGDRVGLVVFGGSGRLRFPLTTDLSAASQVISSLETGSVIVEAGTSASQGLDTAVEMFDTDSKAGRVILLITDGDDLGSDPAGVATRIRASGIDLLVAGAGTGQGGTVPVFDQRTKTFVDKTGSDGKPIITRLNETFLRSLAAAAGGRYIGSDLAAVPGAVAGRLSAIQRARFEEERTTIPVERFQWFAAAALAALLLATAVEQVPRARRRAALAGLVVGALLLGGCATREYELNEQGLDAFQAGDYESAINLFLEAQALRPNDARITLNLAAALHQAGRYDEATLAVRRVLLSPDPEDRARAHASIGHHEFAAGRLNEALDGFKQALIDDPRDEASRHDYEVVFRLLHPPEPPQPEDGQQPDGEQQPGEGQQPRGPSQPGGDAQPPAPQGQGQPGGSPQSQRPTSQEAIERQLAEIDAQVAGLMAEAGDEPTASEALRILQLLAERARIAALRDALSGAPDPNDY